MSADLVAWAVPTLSKLLPLDDESLKQIVTYSAGLSKEAAAEHLKNLLGDSPAALEFIASFNSRRCGDPSSTPQSGSASPRTTTDGENSRSRQNENKNQQKKNKRTKAPLHSAGPPRRPENYGNVEGAYMKADKEEDYIPGTTSKAHRDTAGGTGSSTSLSDVPSLSTKPEALLRPRTTDSPSDSSPATSRNPSPAPKTKAPPSAAGPLISDYLPNVKSKAAKSSRHATSGTSSPSKQSVTTNNIADLTAAIAALEMSTNPTSAKNRQTCNCNASIHPLFTPAPNCLNCGKIICSLEGLQPCSFCGAPLLSSSEVQSMIKELRAERGQEKMRAHNESVHHSGGPGLAADSKLEAAIAHRDKLLSFQAQNAQRTRVVDEAADFETPNVASTQWMTPAQRALALKKQQRILREMQEKARPEWEKKKTVMSLDIKDGRVVRTYQSAPAESAEDVDGAEEEDLDAAISAAGEESTSNGGSALSKNPLLSSGGLVRPVWKGAANAKGTDRAARRSKQTWRRVQDDNDDNEQWILDGGLYGYDNETT
ncbi:hypothetical protein VTN96DRAFT_3885 [Rasamsonia emersonii]|uniref:C2HC5 finger protein n=1 Tax=Rasamsonia emersonii (strain ATCC 16479 / CBS 393.64 / IMI 116815) TaxID=1408163 RepID=A0A0F4YLK6_RASE3|nr:C2HC5 finger protein [Rasamsonia emersonii CBS 393.64]KKA18731.1 C2HC5 finger protein [Rasamsonia emersonii CBS 393.64]